MTATKISASSISKRISKLDLPKSESSRGRISEHRSEGYLVAKTGDAVCVSYTNASTSMKTTDDFLLRQYLAIEKIYLELADQGLDVSLQWPTIKVGA